MIRFFRKLYFKVFKHYRRLELRGTSYTEADRLFQKNSQCAETEQWFLAKEEDYNMCIGLVVFMERKERIRE